ncbi:amino acid adenylation domain-containing protein [Gracilimonas tropica]|uniref:amino acid adenylation domain-containing protein n=1 Tax=Gracilimonas tropica TaxID=454600 RepID=UPI0003819701|nr:amino acid adenylation domain-containing protein [Gracilimonas tropica]
MKMIYDYARHRAGIYPDKVAVSLQNEHLTYWKLETQSNQLAELLLQNGLKPGDRVALLLGKAPRTIIAMHGISKAGGVYVPLDIQNPAERLDKMVRKADPRFLFVDAASERLLYALKRPAQQTNIPFIWWDIDHPEEYVQDPVFRFDDIHNEPDFPHAVVRDPNSPAYILFTSGSAGKPKGVVTTHQNVTSFIDWAKHYFEMNEDDRVSCHSPLHFDLSTFDIYGAFSVGARVFPVPPEMSAQPMELVHFIHENRLTQWCSIPSVLSYLAHFDAVPDRGFPFLKRILCSGEVFPVQSLRYWMKKITNAQFTNLYGPTEATIASSYHTVFQVPAADDDVPIGRACSGEKLWVLNDRMEQVPIGEIGDLYISGLGLSPGYWQDEGNTKQAFIMWDSGEGSRIRLYKTGDRAVLGKDLNFYFHGRADHQIKSRGYRIELGEIEQALKELHLLADWAVVPVQKDQFEGVLIGCAYVPGKTNISPASLKSRLEAKIPAYMIPQFWQTYAILPRNSNGKIDRKFISDQFSEKNMSLKINHPDPVSH